MAWGISEAFGRAPVTGRFTTVSVAAVGSSSIIGVTLQGRVAVGSWYTTAPPFVVVTSINPGVSFDIGLVVSYAVVGSWTAMWTLRNFSAATLTTSD